MNKKELKKAFKEGLIDEGSYKQQLFEIEMNPKKNIRKKQMLPKSLTPGEWKRLLYVIPENDKISRTAFLLAYGSGLRIGEVVGSDKNSNNVIPPISRDAFNFDLKPPQIKIYGKYSKERVVPVAKGWRAYMGQLLPIKLTARSMERRFKKYSKKAKLNPEYTFHSLRHGFATRLLDAGVPIHHVQYLLGHANLATTSRYTQARPKDALNSYENLF